MKYKKALMYCPFFVEVQSVGKTGLTDFNAKMNKTIKESFVETKYIRIYLQIIHR